MQHEVRIICQRWPGFKTTQAPHGIEMYYLNVMAGPRRNWRFVMDPDLAWIAERDARAEKP